MIKIDLYENIEGNPLILMVANEQLDKEKEVNLNTFSVVREITDEEEYRPYEMARMSYKMKEDDKQNSDYDAPDPKPYKPN